MLLKQIIRPTQIQVTLLILGLLTAWLCLSSCATSYGQHQVIDANELPPLQWSERQADTAYLDFMALGDTGTGGQGQQQVANAMARHAAAIPPAFVLLLGDNFYELGVASADDSAWTHKFEQIYAADSLQVPFYAVLGNHDHYGNIAAQLDYAHRAAAGKAASTRWTLPARYYSFSRLLDDGTDVLFVALDTEPLVSPFGTAAERQAQLDWLQQTLAGSRARWKIVFGHHPLYSGGMHGHQARLIDTLEPIFVQQGVDLYLAGHDHDQQMLQPRQGVHYIVSGAGGKSRDVRWLPETLYAATNLGFTQYRVSAHELQLVFINGRGEREFAWQIHKD